MSFGSSTEKRQYVRTMFGRIARHYDLMNRVMTLGQDAGWRRVMVRAAGLPQDGRLLDVATGTGDVAFAALRDEPTPSLVVGLDFALPMLQLAGLRAGRTRAAHGNTPKWAAGDTLCLPFASGTFDAVASAFLMRNVTDVAAALREHMRVTRAGGRVLILDVPRPAGRTIRSHMFRLYFHRLVPLLGQVITGQRDAYKYLPISAETFLTPAELAGMMESIGFQQVRYQLFMIGTVALHMGIRPQNVRA
jgi:demethylmenaquinone methyltransferase/2-methoxy-6-polyprenyl-1,4-benzoquinol methylase